MAEVISRRSIMYDIILNADGAKKGAQEVDKAVKGVGKTASGLDDLMKGIGKGIAAAFAVEKVLAFAKQATELADKAQAIRVAFDKLDGVSLAKLRAATGGAVDDIVLMQKAVQASNFKIPLQELEKLFRFATIRAKETGESVDVLVDSIIEGLGGGSARAFKALGISSDEFQRKVKQTGNTTQAVTQLIDESFRKTGDSLDGLVDAGDKLTTSMTNFQITIGSMINDGFLDDFKDSLSRIIDITNNLITGQQSYNEELGTTSKIIKQFTEEDTKNLISSANLFIEIRKQEAEQGRRLSEIEIQALKDRFDAQAQALINSTKVVKEESAKQQQSLKDAITFEPGTDDTIGLEFEKSIGLVGDLQAKLSTLNKAIPTAQTVEELNKIRLEIALTEQALSKLLNPQLNEFAPDVPEDTTENDALTLNNELTKANIDLKNEQLAATQSLFDLGAGLLQQNAEMGTAFLILSKGLAVAEVIIKLQQTLAGLQAGAAPFLSNPLTAGPATALLAAQSAKARIGAAVNIGTILATTVPALKLAEGEIDINRPWGERGKDSIPAMLAPGESVLTARRTKEYKPVIEAIHAGNLDDVIRVNYLEPALALKSLEGSQSDKQALLDYSERFYRQLLETKDTNSILKKIEYKIGQDHDRSFFLKLKRKF